jgi:hypothetical protein
MVKYVLRYDYELKAGIIIGNVYYCLKIIMNHITKLIANLNKSISRAS